MNKFIIVALMMAITHVAPVVQAVTCNPNIRRSAPDERYVLNAGKGTVLDQQTGLMWKRCVEGQFGSNCGVGSTAWLNWGDALLRAEVTTFAGYKDWRIPNSKELESLVEVACYSPALNATVFPNDPNTTVWASSPHALYTSAWLVYFYDGYSDSSSRYDGSHAVRLVRGGQ